MPSSYADARLAGRRRARIVRWTLVGLYGLVVMSFTTGGILSATNVAGHWIIVPYPAVLLVVTQTVLVLGAGTSDLFRPLRRRRLLVPVVTGGLMLAVLVLAMAWGIDECAEVSESWHVVYLPLFGLSWVFWGVVLFVYTRRTDRYRTLCRVIGTVFAGSLVELLVAAPMHMVVSRRPGCFVGFQTAGAVFAGLYVMLWSMGPAIILLFLREKRRMEQDRLAADHGKTHNAGTAPAARESPEIK
jgi:hypothetical protein